MERSAIRSAASKPQRRVAASHRELGGQEWRLSRKDSVADVVHQNLQRRHIESLVRWNLDAGLCIVATGLPAAQRKPKPAPAHHELIVALGHRMLWVIAWNRHHDEEARHQYTTAQIVIVFLLQIIDEFGGFGLLLRALDLYFESGRHTGKITGGTQLHVAAFAIEFGATGDVAGYGGNSADVRLGEEAFGRWVPCVPGVFGCKWETDNLLRGKMRQRNGINSIPFASHLLVAS